MYKYILYIYIYIYIYTKKLVPFFSTFLVDTWRINEDGPTRNWFWITLVTKRFVDYPIYNWV